MTLRAVFHCMSHREKKKKGMDNDFEERGTENQQELQKKKEKSDEK